MSTRDRVIAHPSIAGRPRARLQALFASPLSGFKALFVARADYDDVRNRTASKSLEWIWQGSPSLGAQTAVWTNIMNLGGSSVYYPWNG